MNSKTTFAVYVSTILISTCRSAVMTLIPLYVLSSGGSEAFAASMNGLRGLGSFGVNLPAGAVMARCGARAVMIGSVALFGGGVALLLLSSYSLALTIGVVFIGAGFGSWHLSRSVYVSRFTVTYGRALASLSGMGRFGSFLGPMAAGFVVGIVGYQNTYLLLLGLPFLVVILLGCFLVTREPYEGSDACFRFVPLFREHYATLLTAGLVILVIKLVRSGSVALIPVKGVSIGMSEVSIGLLIGVSSIAEVVLAYPGGVLLDRFGPRAAAILSLIVSSTGLFFYSISEVLYVPGTLLLSVGTGLNSGLAMTLGLGVAPNDGRSEFLGLWRLVTEVGAFVGPFLVSIVLNWYSNSVAATAVALTGVSGVLFTNFVLKNSQMNRKMSN